MAEQLNYYHDIYQRAVGFTELQGFEGVRWPKMVGTEGQNSPSSIGSYLIWQQPYLIYLAEQLYLANPKGLLKAVALMSAGWEGCAEKIPAFRKTEPGM